MVLGCHTCRSFTGDLDAPCELCGTTEETSKSLPEIVRISDHLDNEESDI